MSEEQRAIPTRKEVVQGLMEVQEELAMSRIQASIDFVFMKGILIGLFFGVAIGVLIQFICSMVPLEG